MRIVVALSAMMICGSAAAGQVYKCPSTTGSVEFRDTPCKGSNSGTIEVKPNVVTPIDQTSDLWLSRSISERAVARQRADEADAALRGAYVEPSQSPPADASINYLPAYPYGYQNRRPPAVAIPQPPSTLPAKTKKPGSP